MMFSLVKLKNSFLQGKEKGEKNASLIAKASHYFLKQHSGVLIAFSKMGINILETGEKVNC